MNTMELLEKALKLHPAPYWTKKLKLSRGALHTAKTRGHLSPSIAGSLAEELGENYQFWFNVGALESERDSACKTRMMRKFLIGGAIALGAAGASATEATVYYVKWLINHCLLGEPSLTN